MYPGPFFIPPSKADGPKFATISDDHVVGLPRPKTTNRFSNVSTSSTVVNNIPTRISARKSKQIRTKLPHTHRNLSYVNIIKQGPTKPKPIPQCFVVNARSIVKPDVYPALYAEQNCHNIDLCCISETWLHPTISSSLICPPGFHIIRKDRLWSRGGYNIQNIQNMDNPFECLWARITTQNSSFDIAVVYHPPEHEYDANDLIDFLTDSSEQLLLENPNAKIIITGDLIKLNIYNLLNQLSFSQLVKSPTRGENILDVFYHQCSPLLEKS